MENTSERIHTEKEKTHEQVVSNQVVNARSLTASSFSNSSLLKKWNYEYLRIKISSFTSLVQSDTS